MFTYACNVGRLVEVRFAPPVSLDDVEGVGAAARRLMTMRDGRFVCAVDLRGLTVLAPTVADALLSGLRAFNPRIERTAVLLPVDAPTLALQIERVHREAGKTARRTFRDVGIMSAWLGAVLNDNERAALARFVG